MVQLEEPLYIFYIQGFCNNIYNNAHKIIGWDPKKWNNNAERGTVVMANASDVGTGGGRMSEGDTNRVQGMYSPIPRNL